MYLEGLAPITWSRGMVATRVYRRRRTYSWRHTMTQIPDRERLEAIECVRAIVDADG